MKSETSRLKKHAWAVLLSFGFVYLFLYNGRQNINLVFVNMAEYFNTSTTAIGVISSSLFWCYAIGQLINGRLGSLFGHKRFMIIGIIMSIILNIIISYQDSIPIIAILWGLNGFFQSMVWSNGIGVLNKWWPKEKRGLATGIATAFSGLAQVITYLSVTICLELKPELGWRAGFRYPIIPIIFMLIPFGLLFKNTPESIGLKPLKKEIKKSQDNRKFLQPYKILFSNKKMLLLCLISIIAGIGRYGLLTWIPTYFMEALGLSIKEGIFSSILLPVGQAFSMFLFPFLTDKIFKGKREPMLLLASVLTFCCMIIFPFIHTKTIASIIVLLAGIFSMITGVIWSIAGDIGGSEYTSTAAGILDWAVYMGAAIQAFIFGSIKDVLGWNAIFITIGCLYVIMLILTNLLKRSKLNESTNI